MTNDALPSSSIHASRVPAGLMSTSMKAGMRPKASTGGGAAATALASNSASSASESVLLRLSVVTVTPPRFLSASPHDARLVPLPVAIFFGRALVVLFLALGETDLELGAAIL